MFGFSGRQIGPLNFNPCLPVVPREEIGNFRGLQCLPGGSAKNVHSGPGKVELERRLVETGTRTTEQIRVGMATMLGEFQKIPRACLRRYEADRVGRQAVCSAPTCSLTQVSCHDLLPESGLTSAARSGRKSIGQSSVSSIISQLSAT